MFCYFALSSDNIQISIYTTSLQISSLLTVPSRHGFTDIRSLAPTNWNSLTQTEMPPPPITFYTCRPPPDRYPAGSYLLPYLGPSLQLSSMLPSFGYVRVRLYSQVLTWTLTPSVWNLALGPRCKDGLWCPTVPNLTVNLCDWDLLWVKTCYSL